MYKTNFKKLILDVLSTGFYSLVLLIIVMAIMEKLLYLFGFIFAFNPFLFYVLTVLTTFFVMALYMIVLHLMSFLLLGYDAEIWLFVKKVIGHGSS